MHVAKSMPGSLGPDDFGITHVSEAAYHLEHKYEDNTAGFSFEQYKRTMLQLNDMPFDIDEAKLLRILVKSKRFEKTSKNRYKIKPLSGEEED